MGAWRDVHERLRALEAMELRLQAVEAAVHPREQRIIPIRGDEEPRMRFRTPERDKIIVPWFAIEDVKPPNNVFLMVTGPGEGDQEFLTLAKIDEEFRPSRGGPLRWISVGFTELTDYGWTPTHWAHRILLPGDLR